MEGMSEGRPFHTVGPMEEKDLSVKVSINLLVFYFMSVHSKVSVERHRIKHSLID